MDRNPVFRRVLVVLGEQRGGIVGIEDIAELPGIRSKVVLRVGLELLHNGSANLEFRFVRERGTEHGALFGRAVHFSLEGLARLPKSALESGFGFPDSGIDLIHNSTGQAAELHPSWMWADVGLRRARPGGDTLH